MKVIGIDPGKTGWWCLLDSETRIASASKLPFREDGILDLEAMPTDFNVAYVEKVHVNSAFMPSAPAFVFGVAVGQILAWVSAYRYVHVTPVAWQKRAFAGITKTKEKKSQSKEAFAKLNPKQPFKKLDHNMCDSFLIAEHGLHENGIIIEGWTWKLKKDA